MMPLTRAALSLLLLLPAAALAQEPNVGAALSAVVRISGTREGATVRGSGFVIALSAGKATIVTAAHVIEGLRQITATFAVDPTENLPAGDFVRLDADNANGVAVFQVRGEIPVGVTPLSFEVLSRPRAGEVLFLLGFPEMAPDLLTKPRVLSGRSGALLLLDQGIDEGFSGGPVLQGGKVVGVVTAKDDETTYAVNAVVARETLEGWGIKLGDHGAAPQPKPAPPPVAVCRSGEGSTENGIAYVRICPGTFTMGSADKDPQAYDNEKPAHKVTLRSEYWLGKTEVTNAQYRLFDKNHQGEATLPATGVTWAQAKAACEAFGGRLPTEAEWEYAAAAGGTAAWSVGAEEKRFGEHAWFAENADNSAHPVATRKSNAWGLHDMYGNVWEWVRDWYDLYAAEAQTDPAGPTTGEFRVLRGGSYSSSARDLRSAFRFGDWPEGQFRYIGFRCVRGPRRQP